MCLIFIMTAHHTRAFTYRGRNVRLCFHCLGRKQRIPRPVSTALAALAALATLAARPALAALATLAALAAFAAAASFFRQYPHSVRGSRDTVHTIRIAPCIAPVAQDIVASHASHNNAHVGKNPPAPVARDVTHSVIQCKGVSLRASRRHRSYLGR